MKSVLRFYLIIVITLISFSGASAGIPSQQQQSAALLLKSMTPEEKVGQLFLLTFNGSEVYETDLIYELVTQHHISGVVLKASKNNFISLPDTLPRIKTLTERLQFSRYSASLQPTLEDPDTGSPKYPEYVPLIIGIAQEGDGAPYSQIFEGLSPSPSQMAIGATWDPNLALSVGELLGTELQLLGINLLLGPSLDVLEDPRLAGPGDIGVRSFGGDPYWVSLIGEAYIEGVHNGSSGRVGVIPKHFPGLGGADRPPEEEIATVRKSLAELEQIDLIPFFNVANIPPGEGPSIADGFLSSNTRYQGFQGNIRATTRPVSLDRDAFDQLLSLEGFVDWREGGGLTVSDSLGSRGIRRFIESLGQSYKGHLVAKDAFLAGNDLLLLEDIKSDTDEDEATTILSTLAFFAQKYVEDTVFAQRVDEAVLRILNFKLRLYGGSFDISEVIPQQSYIGIVGENSELTTEIARKSATLISPSHFEMEERVGAPPDISERIMFISDSRVSRQCSICSFNINIPVSAFAEVVKRLYGQAAAGQIGDWNLSSFTMADLANYLGELPTEVPAIPLAPIELFEESLFSADWIVFSILRSSEDVYGSSALKKLLDSRPDIVLDKRVVVFGHDVPYELDSTDISKIDVYYSLYAKSEPFIEYAARLLFQEVAAEGSSPVSVPGIGYDLIEITSSDPDQVIEFEASINGELVTGENAARNPLIGDVLEITTGMIVDMNGNQVPDGTPVEFILDYQSENIPSLELATTTRAGIARVSETLDRAGTLEIRVESLSARTSDVIVLTVQEESTVARTETAPTEEPSETDVPPQTEVAEIIPTETTDGGGSPIDQSQEMVDLDDLLISLIATSITGGVAFLISTMVPGVIIDRVRILLVTVIGSLIGYNYLALGLPGSSFVFTELGRAAGVILSIAGGTVAFLILMVWLIWERDV
ncbi:MAG: glycoside hydrolase family 3 protein [Anaerolineales bacterium]|nr:glycoside hydrolase family 3 protein [Anaerolineales bacterium]